MLMTTLFYLFQNKSQILKTFLVLNVTVLVGCYVDLTLLEDFDIFHLELSETPGRIFAFQEGKYKDSEGNHDSTHWSGLFFFVAALKEWRGAVSVGDFSTTERAPN